GLRLPLYRWHTPLFRGRLALLRGRFEEADRLFQQALAGGQRARSDNATRLCLGNLLPLRLEQGRLEELEAPIKGLADPFPVVAAWRCALARICVELGRESEARRELEALAADDFAGLPRDYSLLLSLACLAQVCAGLADGHRAAVLYGRLLPYAGRNVADNGWGSVSRYLGLLATCMARREEAQAHFEAPLGFTGRMGPLPGAARTRYEYAAMLLTCPRPGERERALELLSRALDAAGELGMTRLAQQARALKAAELRHAGAPDYPGGLSAREV